MAQLIFTITIGVKELDSGSFKPAYSSISVTHFSGFNHRPQQGNDFHLSFHALRSVIARFSINTVEEMQRIMEAEFLAVLPVMLLDHQRIDSVSSPA